MVIIIATLEKTQTYMECPKSEGTDITRSNVTQKALNRNVYSYGQ